jgi:hypothetical protein
LKRDRGFGTGINIFSSSVFVGLQILPGTGQNAAD